MNPFWNWNLSLFGQDVEGQVSSDLDGWDPKTQSLSREGGEAWWDAALGRTDAIQEKAKQQYIKDLEKSQLAQGLEVMRPGDVDITGSTTKTELARLYKQAKLEDQLIDKIMSTGQYPGVRADLEGKGSSALSGMLPELVSAQQAAAYSNNPAVIDSKARQTTLDRRHEAQQAENTRRYESEKTERAQIRQDTRADALEQRIADREGRLMELGMQERMFDKRLSADSKRAHKEKMATIIAGLSNLGAAFAI